MTLDTNKVIILALSKAIEKLAKGLSKHPDVQKVLKRTNEDLNEFKKMTITFKSMDDMSKSFY